jgi:hypothetical protein
MRVEEIKLGREMEDTISGLRGIAISMHERIHGNIQVALQPKGDGEKMPEAYILDIDNLQVVEGGRVATAVKAPEVPLKLGEKITEKASGLKGVLIGKNTYLNGCVTFGVQPKVDKENKLPEINFFDWKMLEPDARGKVVEPTEGPATRGPSSRLADCRPHY